MQELGYKKDITKLYNAFRSLEMTSAAVKVASLMKESTLSGEHNVWGSWDTVIEISQKPPPSAIEAAANTYLKPASERLAKTPKPEDINKEELKDAAEVVRKNGIDPSKIAEACIRKISLEESLSKTAGLKSDMSWGRTMEIAAQESLREYERINPNTFTKEEIRIAARKVKVHFSDSKIIKEAFSWTTPFKWVGMAIKGAGKLVFKAIGKLLPFIGIIASAYFGYQSWKKWRKEINFIFTELDAGKYGIQNIDTVFVSNLSAKIDAAAKEELNIGLSNNELPGDLQGSGEASSDGWSYTEEKPEDVSFSTLKSDIKSVFTGRESHEIDREGDSRSFRKKTGNPKEYTKITALNNACQAIMENAYHLLENIITGLTSLWATYIWAAGALFAVPTGGASLVISAAAAGWIDFVVSTAALTGNWARRKGLRKGFINNRSFIIGVAVENQRRLKGLMYIGSIDEVNQRAKDKKKEEIRDNQPDINLIPAISRVPNVLRSVL